MGGCAGWFGSDIDLEGQWNMTYTSNDTTTVMAFNSKNELTSMSIVVGVVTVTLENVNADVSVDGNNVTIVSNFTGGNMTFNGTYDNDTDTINGTITYNIELLLVKFSIDGGEATMTRAN
jgi:hypothetical protein